MPFDPLTLGIGAGVSLLGGLFGGPRERNWQNYWSDVNFKGDFSRLDPYNELQDFGQSAAWSSYNKAGLLGQQMTEGLAGLQRDELSNLRRMTIDSAPTTASLRGIASAQGAGGQMSNVLARQQRMGAQAQASEAYGQQASQVGSRYQQNLLSSLATSEGLRQSALGQYLGAQGSAQQLKGNIQLQRTSQENDIGARIAIANAQGRSQAQQYADQQPENPWLTTGLSLLAQGFADRGNGGGGGGSEFNNSNTLSSATNSMLSGAAQGAMSGLLAQPNHIPVLASDAQRQYGWTNPVAMKDPGMPSPSYRSQSPEMKYSGANNYFLPSFAKNRIPYTGGGGQFGGGGYGFNASGRLW